MPKMKTNSGAKKRFRITRKGTVMKSNAWKSHLLEGKSASRKRRLRKISTVSKTEASRIKRMLPYGS
jgi:large subunit ribosomal protein L35